MSKLHPGNPTWGKALPPSMYLGPLNYKCEFEHLTTRLKLNTREDMLKSHALREWVHKNYNHRYVPEWLLSELGYYVDTREN